MKKKTILSAAFFVSLLPMLANQYGGLKGVQEITGLINLLNPIGIASVALFLIGVWVPFKDKSNNTTLGGLGAMGMVTSEIYKFLTWHVQTITGEISFRSSMRLAFPAFYVGLAVSFAMVIAYFVIEGNVTLNHPATVTEN